jgi:hypothetical protein
MHYGVGLEVVPVDSVFERTTLPCFFLVFVLEAERSVVEP